MKTVLHLSLLFMLVGFPAKKENTQVEPIVVEAYFDGYAEEVGFTFSFVNDDDDDETIIFKDISSELLKKYPLKANELTGEEFQLTYTKSSDEIPILVLVSIKKIS